MKKVLLTAGALVLAACTDASAPVPAPELVRTPGSSASLSQLTARPGHYIVRLRDGVADAPGLSRALVAAHRGVLEFSYEHAIKGFAAELSDAAVATLRNHSDVLYVEPDGYAYAITTQTGATWGIDRTDQRDLPLSTTYTYTSTGSGVHAYTIDTGIRRTHVEFGGRASFAFDAIGDGNGDGDCNGHGTHVSGTIGGSTYGIAKNVSLHNVRVLDCFGSGSWAQVIAGVDWVTANHISPAVANMSLGGSATQSVDDAVRASIASGVTYAIAAGNSNLSACFSSPARVTEALTVNASTITDARASFSNFGTCTDIFAPGQDITSAWGSSDTAIETIDGTSMASPHVAGTVARYLEVNPTATPSAVGAALLANATSGKITNPGTGSPNLLLYNGFIDGAPPVNQPPVASFTFSCTGLTCSFNSSGSTDDVGITARRFLFGDDTKSFGVVSPSKTYAAAGTYNVQLDVMDGGGLIGTQIQSVTVSGGANQPPVASFTFSCTGLTCTFDSSSSTDDVGITDRRLNFGDGSAPSSAVVVTKTYATGGTYNVRLSVRDGAGLQTATTQAVTVP